MRHLQLPPVSKICISSEQLYCILSLFIMDDMAWEFLFADEVQGYVDQNGVSNIEEFIKNKLERWQDIEVNIGITGDSGTGKSSFINSIRGLFDDDEKAAEVGVTEGTAEPTAYDHPANPKIKFWDLPGIGTPNYPVETYCEQVQLERYHTFLIFTASRFTENDLKLAEKIRSIDKKFFFIRTKIDENVRAEKRKRSFNEDAMLEEIRCYCSENLGKLLSNEQDIFLISNHHPANWDFDRLTKAILDVLPTHQRESLTLSLGVLTSLSTEILKRKVEVLKGRIWMVASASGAAAIVPIPGLSVAVDIGLIMKEITFYRSQLGLPEEGSAEFAKLNGTTQDKVRKLCLTTAAQISGFLAAYASEAAVEEFARFVPLVGLAIAGGMSFATTYYGLKHCLEKVEESALLVLSEAAQKSADDLEID